MHARPNYLSDLRVFPIVTQKEREVSEVQTLLPGVPPKLKDMFLGFVKVKAAD